MNLLTADARNGNGEETGFVQKVEPRVRILLSLIFAAVTLALRSPALLAAALALAGALACLARLPPAPLLRRLLALEAFMVPVVLFLPFTAPGPAIAEIAGYALSRDGIEQALRLVLTSNAVALTLLSLVGTIEPTTLGHALLQLGVPDKLARMLLLTVRYVAVLHGEYARLRLAMRARAFQPHSDRHTWTSFGYLFGMLLVRSFERSERVGQAMKCRGFSGRFLTLDALPPTRADWAFAGVLSAAIATLGVCQFVVA
ncbi:MAG: cobalt ECF transporter T component CbiQ [Rhodospirillales bacterium]|nr:cobalt ECF transporter T component CbiQ [Rhodospirillales bacterium]